ncbi:MAG TPA: RNA-binding S4 domain-containing protein [Xanthobacteraceae bacterium]|nr:RNA-binding S4 domain-containing protein [Xanthobacteraceae bacterium]
MRDDRQRIDRWLWHARLVRTRTAAAELAESGRVRLNGDRVTASSRPVKIGDVLTVALGGSVKILKVERLSERRGSAADAQALCEDLSPAAAPRDVEEDRRVAEREPGSGRPTKRERRALEKMRHRGPH